MNRFPLKLQLLTTEMGTIEANGENISPGVASFLLPLEN
jgi:hypothetical protein